jgi:hypothetical protein
MAMIMIKCPKTGKDVATGIKMEQMDFDSSDKSGNSTRFCSHLYRRCVPNCAV